MVRFFPTAPPMEYRDHRLTELCSGKKVLVHGCMDDLEKMVRQIRDGRWPISRISEAAVRCVGITTNGESARTAADEFGYGDVVCADIVAAPHPEITSGRWDYLILADSLEHYDDPFGTLTRLRANYAGSVDGLIITVPNAFSLDNRRYATAGREFVHSDHRFWFTPYTLMKVLYRAGWALEAIWMCEYAEPDPLDRINPVRRIRLRRHPLLRNTIVASCRTLRAPPIGAST